MQQNQPCKVPHRLIQEGGVVVLPGTGAGVVQAHPGKGLRGRAEGLPVEEVAPASGGLPDEETQAHQIQHGSQLQLFDPGEHGDADNGPQNAAVDGDAALPDVQHRDGVGGVILPGKRHIVDPGTDNGKGCDPEDAVKDVILRQAELLAPAGAIEGCQEQARGNDDAVKIDVHGPQRNGAGRVYLNPQGGEGNSAVVSWIHAYASFTG